MVILILFVLLGIAFVTLFERKILGLVQIRKGPNKVIYKGFLQPMRDGIKLFLKENLVNINSNKYFFAFYPYLFFFFIILFWFLFIFKFQDLFKFRVILFVLISGLGIYGLFGRGWSSNSKYSLLGAYRRIAQTISYEVRLIFFSISIFIYVNSYNLVKFTEFKVLGRSFFIVFWSLFILWLVVLVSELNRSPFDFSERESELVSGFNIEYGGGKFAFLFLAEYGNIIFISYLTAEIFVSNYLYFFALLIIFLIILVRGTFPRYRYDNLIFLNWKVILPFILLYFFNLIYFILLVI